MTIVQGVEILKFHWYSHRLPVAKEDVQMGDVLWVDPQSQQFRLTLVNPHAENLLWGYAAHDANKGDEIACCFSLTFRIPMVIAEDYSRHAMSKTPTEPYAPKKARWFLVELGYALLLEQVLNYSASKPKAGGFPHSDTSMPVQRFHSFMKGLGALR